MIYDLHFKQVRVKEMLMVVKSLLTLAVRLLLRQQLINLTRPRVAFAPKNQHTQNVSFLW